MQDIRIEEPDFPSTYWSNVYDRIIRFHLNDPVEEIALMHRTGFNKRTISVEELAIEGISWESLLMVVYDLSDLETVCKLDEWSSYNSDLYKILTEDQPCLDR